MKNELVIKEKTEFNTNTKKKSIKKIIFLILAFVFVFGIGGIGGFVLGKRAEIKKQNESAKVAGANDQNQQPEELKASPDVTQTEAYAEYTVQDGDTLFKIGLKFNMPWTDIAKVNNLSENSVIKTGMVLKIPNLDTTSDAGLEQKTFTIDQTTAQASQDKVNNNEETWRLDPVSVAKKETNGVLGISENDVFNLKSKNFTSGEAIVEITVGTQIYQAVLIQPVDKGPNGIWVAQSVKRI